MSPNEECNEHEGILPAIHTATQSHETTNCLMKQDNNVNNNNVRITSKTNKQNATMEVSNEPENTKGNLKQYCETLCIYVGVLMVGCAAGILGPTLVHVTILYGTDTTAMSSVFIFLNIGYFLGSLSSGLLFDRLNSHLQDSAAMLTLGLSLIAAPYMPNMYLYQVNYFDLNY